MYFFSRLFLSYKFIIFMLLTLALGAAVATFIENDYDAQTAKVLVYNSFWYETVMIILTISLVGVIIKQKMYKRAGAFIFHLGFVFVLIGAGVTRYFGYEGVIHIREGMTENRVISEESYLQIKVANEVYEHPLALGKIGDNSFEFTDKIDGKDFVVNFLSYKYTKGTNVEQLFVNVSYDGIKKLIEINGGHGSLEPASTFEANGKKIELSWGSKIIKLPFNIKLRDFQIERYPGSQSPSSYASAVELIDNSDSFNYGIYMNNPLTYKGFKFFQSSYDRDEKGTVLSVNRDPGKWPTYFAYFLLSLGFVLNFFTKKSRFDRLRGFLINNNLSLILPLLVVFSITLKADTTKYLDTFRANTQEHAKSFAQIYVQDYNGRVKPMGTEAIDILNKMSGKSSLYGLTATQIMLGVLADSALWEEIKLIKIKNSEIKKLLKLPEDTKMISFSQAFDSDGKYILNSYVNDANEKMPSKRGTFEKDLIKLDERLNIFYLATMGMFYNFIPNPYDSTSKWYSPQKAIDEPWLDQDMKSVIFSYINGLNEGILNNNWNNANQTLEILKINQKEIDGDILPSEYQTKIELLSNELKIFQKLTGFYFILGVVSLIFAIVLIFFKKEYPFIKNILFALLLLGFIAHTLGLGMRWYISGHAPWSDTYESLIYVGWSAILAGILVFRKSLLSLSSAAILGAIIMLVANLNFISPQITPLVPVLKSYWLSIHVSIITASYGFLGFSALLAFLALDLMIFKTEQNRPRVELQIRQLAAIAEISIIIGLSMLTVGNFIGGVWANESWGRYWGWDPKETWSFISIIVYTVVLHLRFIPKLNSVYVFLVATVFAFSSIIMTYFGVNFYLSGMHSYATGDKVPVPSFIYYVIGIVLLIVLFAYPKKEVKVIK
ncbi:cytochrome c biogenesis protein CcsA [Halarcobacter ebronensis]|uniref:NAD(FAD)-utilizing dehydrogenase n=1 Tax=Halarcobacter ebronensis TaxID=1462615 RepID=A0A4Q1AQ55_9BACT|nr:cytochrome c biogenesis protein CcsA [Halarcobacter ebronensis]QKF82587.1 cytochrome c biogenesis protein [Halarcobacter ebronensis]RXK07402.1 NAD(FAD)-utilizing dehydrogenase [Halarcobacter ebronensis]